MINSNKNLNAKQALLYQEDDSCVFVPKEFIDSFHHVFNCVKEARYELIKVAEAMKPI